MPIPAKPCAGLFSDETIAALVKNDDRAQWHPQVCSLCQQEIGARLVSGKWVPDQHWPSVRYVPRTRRTEKRAAAAKPLQNATTPA
jgi:hypothetical protein